MMKRFAHFGRLILSCPFRTVMSILVSTTLMINLLYLLLPADLFDRRGIDDVIGLVTNPYGASAVVVVAAAITLVGMWKGIRPVATYGLAAMTMWNAFVFFAFLYSEQYLPGMVFRFGMASAMAYGFFFVSMRADWKTQ